MFKVVRKVFAAACIAVGLLGTVAQAAELKIGFKAEITSADPHVLNSANRNIWAHVYDSLVAQDHQLRPKPSLALSWRMINPTTWEFKLRPDVKFHDGQTMTAEDVKYSIDRAMNLSGPRTFRSYLREVSAISVSGPLTVQVKTKHVSPTLPDNLGLIAILPKSLGEHVSEESFANGKSAIGTGPYRFGSWLHGQKLVLNKNPSYWGEKEPWDSVSFQFIPREPARAAALLSGSVDIINDITANMERSLRAFKLVSLTSYMLNYLALDQFRDISPFVRDATGVPLKKNPMKDIKVRQAMMMAINRDGIIKYLMKDDATAAQQLVPKGFFGYDPELKLPGYDAAKARELLAQAGYPQGFQLTLHCPNNRYVNDARLCEAVAQQWSQAGIRTDVATMPYSVFQTRAFGSGANGEPEFSAFLVGNGAVTGDSLTGLVSIIHSYNAAASLGVSNYGRYSNKGVDALIERAAGTTDDTAREDLQRQASRLALTDVAIIPLQHLNAFWAMKQTLVLTPRADGFTMAMDIRQK
ncbi:ABC transporter substrate-binding protein [Herbaspirillum rubrisubalbicans]|uniref:ABC transporter substrate-binding protein n=1 Tax=Herbaspirillum rubrisubalbicans TaxID=80842 RepID=A0ABX9C8B4_9BURK|nr:ABC transporter substrate-binding protein [Herbaspirillum rubrisubalbicans]RAM67002.1 ABC transporter substrate-binding protein [Herbaspirillum rubrisubalbicans]RAN49132.1 ABC transporter substrate-binding protein [Herbaspirillum rubrisubalbicans]